MAVNRSSPTTTEQFPGDIIYKKIFRFSQDSTFVCCLNSDGLPGNFIEVSESFCKLVGYTKAELQASTPFDLAGTDLHELLTAGDRLIKDKRLLVQTDWYNKSGHKLKVEIKAHLAKVGRQPVIIGTISDKSRTKAETGLNVNEKATVHSQENKAELQSAKISSQALLDVLPDPIVRLNRHGVVLEARSGKDDYLLSYAKRNVGKNIDDFLPRRIANLTLRYIEKVFKTKTIQTYDYQTAIEGINKAWEIRLVNSGPDEVLAIIRDITESREREKRLMYLSLHDSLTGIYNRAFIEQEMYRIQQEGRGPVGIIMCDLDRLKQVNDTLGHSSGDNLLIAAANVIKKAVRRGDIVARIGGDEFVILLPEGDLAAAKSIYERIQQGTAIYNAQNPAFPISMSVGYAACSRGESVSMPELLKEADLNMYQEKVAHCKA